MSHWRIAVGALFVIGLGVVSPVLGLGLLLALLLAGVIGWAIGEKEKGRPCPRCGEQVANGILECGHCGFDFNTIGAEG